MIRARNVYLVLALGSLAALPACSRINSMMGNRPSSSGGSMAASQPVANDMVRQVQARLQQDGYYKQGNVDGVWGAGTMNAVEAFQRDHNLTASGKLDVPTLQALNIADTGNNPSMTPATTGPAATGPANDPTRVPGSTTPNTANPTPTGPNTTYTGPNSTYPAPNTTTPATRQP